MFADLLTVFECMFSVFVLSVFAVITSALVCSCVDSVLTEINTLLHTAHFMVLLRHTSRTTVTSSRTWDVDISGLLTSTRVSSHGHSHRLATGVFL